MDSPEPDDEVDEHAFMEALTPSPELAAVIGNGPMPRAVVVTELWNYIKEHKLQDAQFRRLINADEKLKKVFGKSQVSMFEMAPLIGKHLR
ncbi:MAG: DNA topoisomerase III [Comamonadaceae bacterium]|nr:MAG: DNA topoisomerase III [Comamonadaceae bacterium]